jgi:LysM repeat protein
MKLSRAIFIVIIMHVIAVGGMLLFQHLRDSRLAQSGPTGAVTEPGASQRSRTSPVVARPSVGIRMHYVEAGQSLSEIARIYRLSVDEVAAENGISDPGQIKVGQELRIPVAPLEQAEPLDVNALTSAPPAAPGDGELISSSPSRSTKPRRNLEEPLASERTGSADPIPASPIAQAPATPSAAEVSLREQFLRAKRGGTTAPEVRKAEPAGQNSAPPVSAAPASRSPRTYVVQKGDNPVAIAQKYDVSYSALLKLNNISDPRKLQIGQSLKIPAQ